jgi:ArsR family metal-binding transcriptional regulator
MLIESYRLEITVSTHSVQHADYEAIAYLDGNIREVLPYLNAVLGSAVYVPSKPALAWRYEGHKVAFWPDRIAVDELESRTQAEEVIRLMVKLVNVTWERRGKLTPDTTVHQRRQPLELYHLLPRTNCRQCGEVTCFNFALQLVAGRAELSRCRPLYEEAELESRRRQLEELLAGKWPAL